MKSFIVLPVALMASMAAAQSVCGAEYILDACLDTENAKFNSCNDGDWDCKCASYQAIMTCFNNCPNDSRRATQDGQRQIYCGYASQFPSKTTAVAANTASATGAAAAAVTTTGSAAAAGATTGTASSTAAAATKTGAASDLAMNAGGILACVAAVVMAISY